MTDALTALIRDAVREVIADELAHLRTADPAPAPGAAADPDEILTTRDAARLTGVSEHTLAHWRCDESPDGPPWIRLGGRRVGYRRRDLQQWLASRVTAA